jgi:CRISPR-associated protein (TIGR02710 family)
MKTLFLTVGGSPQPIVTAIHDLAPERVIFICSSGPKGSLSQVTGAGNPCEVRSLQGVEKLPNIPTQAGLEEGFDPNRDVFLIDNPDDFAECYQKAADAIAASGEGELLADYTGGTKTMSVGLAMAALDRGVTLFLTTGNRTNLLRVERGEMTEMASFVPVLARRSLEQSLPIFLSRYDYSAALSELRQQLSSLQLPTAFKSRFRNFADCCNGLDAWDRFDHREALAALAPLSRLEEYLPLYLFLKRVISSRSLIDKDFQGQEGIKGHGYEIIEDLLLNAERRAVQERYDDAVGRLYRATELLVQMRLLFAYGIKTGDVEIEKLPEILRSKYERLRNAQGKIQIALKVSYELLTQLENDPLGQIYLTQSSRIENALQVRNYSLFAHGFHPITQSNYKAFYDVIVTFIREGIAAIVPVKYKVAVQFPKAISL